MSVKSDAQKYTYTSADFLAIYNAVSKDIRKNRSLSGGDRIFVELTKRWRFIFGSYSVLLCSSAERLMHTYIPDMKRIKTHIIPSPAWMYENILFLYLYKTIRGLFFAFTYKPKRKTFIFSSSDFIPDVLPACYIKLTNKNVKWIAAFYFFASSPFSKEFPYKGIKQRIRGSLYYLTQQVAYILIKRYSDFVILCNEVDRKKFIAEGYLKSHIYPIYGGVDLAEANAVPSPAAPSYDAVFMARFHPQKGPMMAVKAWELVIKKKPLAILAMIGNGPLEEEVKKFIHQHDLEKNIILLGFKDGKEKYEILKSARLFLHSAVYETGGMAAAEGMAAGLPVIAFDHPGFNYCYPKGMIRISPIGDYEAMADAIVRVLEHRDWYDKTRREAIEFVQEWDWPKRAEFLLDKLSTL